MAVVVNSDSKKAWIEGKIVPHIFNAVAKMPGKKKYIRGIPYFEMDRANIEYLDSTLEDVEWKGPAAKLVSRYRAMHQMEIKAREQRNSPIQRVEIPYKLPPYEHQQRAHALASGKVAFGHFMEQGCVDKDTEYLSPTGWEKISEYQEGKVAQWNLDGTISFVQPQEYHVKPCDVMMHFKTKYGVDQMLSPDHRMLLTYGYRPTRATKYDWQEFIQPQGDRWLFETTPQKLTKRLENTQGQRTKCYVPCSFVSDGEGISLTEAELRVQVAFIADGSYGVKSMHVAPTSHRKGSVRVKKDRKKERLRELLDAAGIPFTEKESADGFSIFTFVPPSNEKHFISPEWWGCSQAQLRVIAEECLMWDGSESRGSFWSTTREDADFIQFCFSASGRRARITDDGRGCFQVQVTDEPLELMKGEIVPAPDGKMFCFTVPSSYLVFRRNGCVFISGNTGKTKVLLDEAAELYLNGGVNGKIDTLIVVAPNGVHAQWANEQVPDHLSPAVPRSAAYTSAAPTPEERQNWAKTVAFKEGLRIFCIHIDSLSHQKGKEVLRELLLGSKSLLAIDESSRIKDPNSKRTKALIDLGRLASYRRILTGTPVSQGAEDLYSQFQFLDEGILGYGSFYAFRNHFCKLGGFQGKKIVGYQNEQELMDKIDSHTFRVLKDDCLDLPERNYIPVIVPMHPEQRRVYDQVRKEFWLELENGEILTAKMAVQRITRLQQIVNGFIWKNAKKDKHTGRIVEPFMYQEFPQNRVEAALNIIRSSRPDTKVIVWIKFQGDYKLMSEALEKEGIGYVDYVGSTPQDKRSEHIERFRTDPKCKVFLSTPKAGGIGLNLTVASEVIWFSRDFSLENELQANDRVHRIGQHRVVNYHFLTSPRTVDEKIDKILRKKLSVAENLIDLRDMLS